MCRLTENMIETAIKALTEQDPELGRSISAMDKQVDVYEMDIEKKCMRILLKQQPVAKDFREVSCALKMITDIERFGDQASDIGDIVYTFHGAPYIKKLTHITEMGKLAIKMVSESVNSFITVSIFFSFKRHIFTSSVLSCERSSSNCFLTDISILLII